MKLQENPINISVCDNAYTNFITIQKLQTSEVLSFDRWKSSTTSIIVAFTIATAISNPRSTAGSVNMEVLLPLKININMRYNYTQTITNLLERVRRDLARGERELDLDLEREYDRRPDASLCGVGIRSKSITSSGSEPCFSMILGNKNRRQLCMQ